MTINGRLKTRLARGEFAVTAEITPGISADPADILAQVGPLRDRVDAINITDAAGARVAVSSLAASALLVRDGVEPVMQITCRDRNRIAISGDLIGAAALGIRNILVLKGDDPACGDEPEAKTVLDLDTHEVVALARRMADDGTIPSGRKMPSRPEFLIGAADVPFDPPTDWKPDRLLEKLEAGTEFVQTQFCFDAEVAQRYFTRLGECGIIDRLPIIVGVGPLASARSARWMNDNLFGVTVPEPVIRRLESAGDEAAEGHRICIELIDAYKEMPGIAGVHLMAPAQSSQRIADVLDDIE